MKELKIICGESQYGVLNEQLRQMYKGFKEYTQDVEMYDLSSELDTDRFMKMVNNPKDCNYFSIQHIFGTLKKSNGEIFMKNNIGSVCCGWIMDHPLYHYNRLDDENQDNTLVCTVDQKHLDFISDNFKIPMTSFLPHGGFIRENDLVKYNNKEIDVFMAGTYKDSENILNSKMDSLNDSFKAVFNNAIDIMNKDESIIFTDAIIQGFDQIYGNHSTSFIKNVIENMGYDLDLYMRTIQRDKIINELLRNKIKVHVLGNGWENFEAKYDGLTIINDDDKSIKNVLKYMNNSKFVLNISYSLYNGSHERVPSSMLQGAISLTNPTTYYNNIFTNMENILYYDINNMEESCENIIKIIENPNLGQEIADNGRVISEQGHTWAHRAIEICEFFDQYN